MSGRPIPEMLDSARAAALRIVRPSPVPCRRVGAPDPARPPVAGTRRAFFPKDSSAARLFCKSKRHGDGRVHLDGFAVEQSGPVAPLADGLHGCAHQQRMA